MIGLEIGGVASGGTLLACHPLFRSGVMKKKSALELSVGDKVFCLVYDRWMEVSECILTSTYKHPKGKFPLFLCKGEGNIPFSYLCFEEKK